jgi:hypothetical protein
MMAVQNFMETAMFILTFVLTLILPGAFLSLALKTSFSSKELVEMGVYLEDTETTPVAPPEPANRSQSGPSCLRTKLST